MNSQWILNIFFFVQIHLKKSDFTFVTRLRRNARYWPFLSHVCGGFNIFLWPLHLRPFIYREVRGALWHKFMFSFYIKTYYKTQAKLKILTKHIEFPTWYSFSSLWILNNFQECACSPCPVNNLLMRKKPRFCWCVWNPRNINGFVLSIDAINELFFFRRRRFVSNNDAVVFDVFFLTSVFVFLKCPEVRLGICFWLDVRRRGVQRLV